MVQNVFLGRVPDLEWSEDEEPYAPFKGRAIAKAWGGHCLGVRWHSVILFEDGGVSLVPDPVTGRDHDSVDDAKATGQALFGEKLRSACEPVEVTSDISRKAVDAVMESILPDGTPISDIVDVWPGYAASVGVTLPTKDGQPRYSLRQQDREAELLSVRRALLTRVVEAALAALNHRR